VPDWEARRVARQIATLVQLGGWMAEVGTIDDSLNGIWIDVLRNDPADKDRLNLAGHALRYAISLSDVDVYVTQRVADLPPGTIRVIVGARPQEYFTKQLLPDWARKMQEETEQFQKRFGNPLK
jgi:hypothetical protein